MVAISRNINIFRVTKLPELSKTEKGKISKSKKINTQDRDIENVDKPRFMEGTMENEERPKGESEEDWVSKTQSPMAGKIWGTMEDLERFHTSEYLMSDEVKACIQDCLDCYRTCTETTAKCLSLGGKHSEAWHLSLIIDCGRMCNLNTDFMLRNSTHYPLTCRITADICDACANSCAEFDDNFMKDCASVCKKCAGSCREMAR